jgi:hypothetical protein
VEHDGTDRSRSGHRLKGIGIEDQEIRGLPAVFDRNDICRAIGYEPDRGSLYRTFKGLIEEGVIPFIAQAHGADAYSSHCGACRKIKTGLFVATATRPLSPSGGGTT